jgi:ubiquinone/menaquinone biosynthesis C-methylase UbiE
MKKKIEILNLDIKKLLRLLDSKTKSHPYIVVMAMHELFRNLYPYDPYIKIEKKNFKRISTTVKNLNNFIIAACKLGAYKNLLIHRKFDTQDLFGKLWMERSNEKKLDSKYVLEELLERNGFNLKFFKNKKILDIGCGSGRFTLAFAKLGAKLSVGVDLGSEGLKIGKSMAKKEKIKNIKFYKSNVLQLPFKDNSFDFVFCKGVLHHTGDTYKGLSELKRVLKLNSNAFIYLYGSGGIFWKTRKMMRTVMKKIPYDYTIRVLNEIGMPSRRTIFVDSWYVPIEDHIKQNVLESWFVKNKIQFKKYTKGKKTELEYMEKKEMYFKEFYGNGELRYVIKK